jgi:hypothetical protein
MFRRVKTKPSVAASPCVDAVACRDTRNIKLNCRSSRELILAPRPSASRCTCPKLPPLKRSLTTSQGHERKQRPFTRRDVPARVTTPSHIHMRLFKKKKSHATSLTETYEQEQPNRVQIIIYTEQTRIISFLVHDQHPIKVQRHIPTLPAKPGTTKWYVISFLRKGGI